MVGVTGIVTGGASALGLAAALASMHLPAKSYRVERTRRLSQPASEMEGPSEMARLALQKTNSAGSITEKVGKPPGKKMVGVMGRVKE